MSPPRRRWHSLPTIGNCSHGGWFSHPIPCAPVSDIILLPVPMVLCLMTFCLMADCPMTEKCLSFWDVSPPQHMDTSGKNTNCAFMVMSTICRHCSFLKLHRTSMGMSWRSAGALTFLLIPQQTGDGGKMAVRYIDRKLRHSRVGPRLCIQPWMQEK